jgi:hypothetical protein
MHKLLFSFSILFFVCIGALYAPLAAQPRFKGGIVAGLSASQIDGDLSAGYNKLGLLAGLRVASRLKKRTEASIEFLYAQRGAQTELLKDKFNPFNFSLTLNYVEVPIQWHFKDWLIEYDDEKDNYYRVSFNAGLSYARFISAKNRDDNDFLSGVVPDFLKKDDFSMLLGANFMANRHIGFTFRYVRSLNFMYDPRDWPSPPAQRGWRGHCLYFQTFYLL